MPNQRGVNQLEEIAAGVHVVLATLHLLGVVYNTRRQNWFDVLAHAAGVVYDAAAAHKHMRNLARRDNIGDIP